MNHDQVVRLMGLADALWGKSPQSRCIQIQIGESQHGKFLAANVVTGTSVGFGATGQSVDEAMGNLETQIQDLLREKADNIHSLLAKQAAE